MARAALRIPENAPGRYFVDSTCIDCGRCREIAPRTFGASRASGTAFVASQPAGEAEEHRARMALVACPTASIGAVPQVNARAAAASFPEEIAPGVLDCGLASADSYGATSYLLRRSEGNVLVDSPRATSGLLAAIERLGGVRWMFLSHRDDVADHRKIRERFRCTRILHEHDVGEGTRDIEWRVEGGDPVALAAGVTMVPVPGHTAGSMALHVDDTYMFTGDHVWGREDGRGLSASRSVCWYSWPEQRASLAKLRALAFTWVLPGHGHRYRALDPAAMRGALDELLARLPRQP